MDQIKNYIHQFQNNLRKMGVPNVNEIVREIESHIENKMSEEKMPADQVLRHLGTPEELANEYRTNALGNVALGKAAYWGVATVKKVVIFLLAIIGYGMGAGFLISGVLKPFFPNNIGFWIGSHIFDIGFEGNIASLHGAHEIMGAWFIPFAIILGIFFWFITAKAIKGLGNWR